ncbi:hypothetical protein [Streptomyces sp. LX-29]|nr:hypothetical protein [Streptomyces sp. LX-29]
MRAFRSRQPPLAGLLLPAAGRERGLDDGFVCGDLVGGAATEW